MSARTRWLEVTFCLLLFVGTIPAIQANDPLAVPSQPLAQWIDLAVSDLHRQREIPICVYLPAGKMPLPVVLFSHGLGGSREGKAFMGKHWATGTQ